MNNLLPSLSQRLAELARSSVQVTGPVNPISDQLPDFQPGERYSAHILENLQDGRARAQVAGQIVTLQLPQGAREGSTVTLVHVSRSAQMLVATLSPDTPNTDGDAVQHQPAGPCHQQPARPSGTAADTSVRRSGAD